MKLLKKYQKGGKTTNTTNVSGYVDNKFMYAPKYTPVIYSKYADGITTQTPYRNLPMARDWKQLSEKLYNDLSRDYIVNYGSKYPKEVSDNTNINTKIPVKTPKLIHSNKIAKSKSEYLKAKSNYDNLTNDYDFMFYYGRPQDRESYSEINKLKLGL